MRGADDARIDRDRRAAADPLDHPLLKEPQQFHLQRQRNVADFVEKQRPALRQLDLAGRSFDRSGKGAALIAEQLGFQQVFRNCRAVDGDELAFAARRFLVHRAGQQFLAGTACAEQHHRNVGVGDAIDRADHLDHFRACGEHRSHCGRASASRLQPPVLGLDLLQVEGAADDQAQFVDVDRLAVEIIGAERDGLERAFARAVAGCDDDLGIGLQREDFGERRKPFARSRPDRAEVRDRASRRRVREVGPSRSPGHGRSR